METEESKIKVSEDLVYGDSPLPGIGPLATLGSWGKVRVFFLSLLGLDCFQIKIL